MLLPGQKFHFVANAVGCLGVLLLLQVPPTLAHHSYSPIDNTRILEVTATVAQLEWTNPHVFLWAYVADETQESGYQLYAFETGSITMMVKAGWTREDTVEVGEEVTIEYLPLHSGEPGGSLGTITHADGTVTPGRYSRAQVYGSGPRGRTGRGAMSAGRFIVRNIGLLALLWRYWPPAGRALMTWPPTIRLQHRRSSYRTGADGGRWKGDMRRCAPHHSRGGEAVVATGCLRPLRIRTCFSLKPGRSWWQAVCPVRISAVE